jgi:hypothetical protein
MRGQSETKIPMPGACRRTPFQLAAARGILREFSALMFDNAG